MLARHQPALIVAGIAVGKIRARPKHRNVAVLRIAQHSLVRDIAPEQAIEIGEPDRPLGPAAIRIELIERGTADDELAEARIVNFINRSRSHISLPKIPSGAMMVSRT